MSSPAPARSGAASEDGPRNGDVIVAPAGSQSARYVITQSPGPPQLTYGSRDAAVDAARRFAEFHAVDVWLERRSGLTRLATHRVDISLSSGPG